MVAGDSRDLPAIRRILKRLPNDSYGQVFIEIVADVQVVPLHAPPGLSISWLRRDSFGPGAPGRGEISRTFGSARGETIERAVLAWATEWIEPGCQCGHSPFYVWVGCAMSPTVDRLHVALRTMLSSGREQADHRHG
jgi:NADPH-dependent ferric siderophore reductase